MMNSFIPWIGGKKLLRKEIVSRFPQEKISKYVEVFGGAGWVLFYKDTDSKQQEIFNDYNSELINLYRCAKYHSQELKRECNLLLNSREMFVDFKSQLKAGGLTDIQRAARYLYLIKVSFGADKDSYGCSNKNVYYAIDMLEDISRRLQKVTIENQSYEVLIKHYDKENVLFYLDPPYYETEDYYGDLFNKDDHEKLRDILKSIKGRFILSYNDCAYIRELYKDFYIETVSRNHNLKSDSSKYKEVIIRNYK